MGCRRDEVYVPEMNYHLFFANVLKVIHCSSRIVLNGYIIVLRDDRSNLRIARSNRTITPNELRRTETLLPLELSNSVNVLSALLASHGMELNSHYTDLVASRVRLQEKIYRKTGYIKVLCLEVTSLDDKLDKVQRGCDALDQENKESPFGGRKLKSSTSELKQIHEDDLKAIDLKWQPSLLSMRAKRYFQRTGKKIFINANDIAGYDKSKVECFNCHKMGHFAWECRAPKNKEGFYWSDMAEEHVQTNMALMAFSNSELDLSYSGLDEFKEPEFKSYGSKDSKKEFNIVCDKKSDDSKENSDDSLVKEHAHCKYHQRERMVYGNNYNKVNYNYTTNRTHPNAQRNMVLRAVLMKTGLKTFNTARIVNTAHPKSTVYSANPMSCFSKSTQSTVKRPFQPKIVLTNKRFTQKINTAKAQAINTARPKVVKTARPNSAVVNAVRDNQANVVKASASQWWLGYNNS
ncbi:ribonuclease H-like domain-containing protein [Tanacetum coccineum]